MAEQKRCARCGGMKPLSEFRPMGKYIDSWCRPCHAEYSAARYRNRRAPEVRDILETALSTSLDKSIYRKTRAVQKAVRALARAIDQELATTRPCEVCGREFRVKIGKQRFCGPDCAGTAPRPVSQKTCSECGTAYDGTPGRRFCSDPCAKRHHRRIRNKLYRAARRGARHLDPVNPLDIFERDGWRCGICGKTVRRDASPNKPDGPTLDHIVPLSKGGDHTAINLQLAHRRCNMLKRTSGAQLRMLA